MIERRLNALVIVKQHENYCVTHTHTHTQAHAQKEMEREGLFIENTHAYINAHRERKMSTMVYLHWAHTDLWRERTLYVPCACYLEI